MAGITRRELLTIGAGTAVGLGAVGGVSALGFDLRRAHAVKRDLRIAASKESKSVCPYCAVGCGLVAYTKQVGGKTQLLQIEGDPDSPINEGRLCPKGASAMQLATSARRVAKPLYRAPGAREWQEKDWDFVLDKLAANLKSSRDNSFVGQDAAGNVVNRTEGVAFAGGAAFSSEEGYLATKLMRSLGVVHLEQQARV